MTFVESCRLSVGDEDMHGGERKCCASCYRPDRETRPWYTKHCDHIDIWVGGTGRRLPPLFRPPAADVVERLSLTAACQ